ncbi:BnaCnng55490D [Brassica napus]|nr:BnaCnng55490D [Brassica napus]
MGCSSTLEVRLLSF